MLLLKTLFATSPPAAAEDTYGPYRADVLRVLDGDTVEVAVRLWPGLVQEVNVRLDGVNTPEKRGAGVTECEKKAAQDATTFTQRWLKGANTVIVDGVRPDKYAGRALGRIRRLTGEDLGEALIAAGHARRYDGGRRGPWCGGS